MNRDKRGNGTGIVKENNFFEVILSNKTSAGNFLSVQQNLPTKKTRELNEVEHV